ncbi:ChaN family lipoprotein [Pseudomonas sp. Pseusp122]|uniref:ChaN family lipoprotein n=1 Tax=unclassified Pseudomonas TaxID=196821 RepID=UPI0039A560E2
MIRDIKNGQDLSAQELAERLAAATHVLVGAGHDDPDHLALQLWLLQSLADRRAQGSLLLPMLTPGQKDRVAAVQADIARGDFPKDLSVALEWQAQWDWALYGPLMRYSMAEPHPVLAVGLSPDEAQAIEQRPQRLSGSHSTSADVRHRLLERISLLHPAQSAPALLAVHQQRDRRMAQELLAAPLPALLFAAAEHVRKDMGVPLHMADLGGNTTPVVLILARSDTPVEPGAADYVWYTSPP